MISTCANTCLSVGIWTSDTELQCWTPNKYSASHIIGIYSNITWQYASAHLSGIKRNFCNSIPVFITPVIIQCKNQTVSTRLTSFKHWYREVDINIHHTYVHVCVMACSDMNTILSVSRQLSFYFQHSIWSDVVPAWVRFLSPVKAKVKVSDLKYLKSL